MAPGEEKKAPNEEKKAAYKLYKTSIEKWHPGEHSIYCPKCGKKHRPLVKSHRENILTLTSIITCWPLCSFPCLGLSPTKEYLHCPVCNSFLGLYDKDQSCLMPNMQFIKNEEEVTEKVKEKTEKKILKEETKKQEAHKKREKEQPKSKKLEEHHRRKSIEEDEFFDASSNSDMVWK